jgi:hypothetical protein
MGKECKGGRRKQCRGMELRGEKWKKKSINKVA